jgi:pimeloyl-ACP methyl ester carboxylesterase
MSLSRPRRALILCCSLVIAMSAVCAADAPVYRDKLNLMVHRDTEGRDHPVQSLADWALRRAHILGEMQMAMGPMPDDSRGVDLDLRVTEEVEGDKWVRRTLTFAPEAGDRVPAHLFIPKGLTGRAPAVLCLHQTTSIGKGEPAGVGGLENLHYARELAERGFVTLAPDYPNFGDYTYDPYANGYVSATMKGIWNHRRGLDLLQSLPEVDPERLGCIGHSLGGHNTLYLAAFDERVKVAVTSCGFNSFFKYMGGDLTGWSHRGYMPRIAELYHCSPEEMPFDFTEVLAAIAPRAVYVNAPVGDDNFDVTGVKDCLFAAGPVYGLYGAADRLVAEHPNCAHDFPPDTRERAYAFIAQALR